MRLRSAERSRSGRPGSGVAGAVEAAFPAPVPVVAAGADQVTSFALMRDASVYLGGHSGDPGDPGSGDAWREGLRDLLGLYSVGGAVVAADLHPGYRSRALAEELAAERGWPVYLVQHHFAHMCAVLLECGMRPGEEALGLILDGTGYGTDGTVWGCEILEGSLNGFCRRGHLKKVPMPGGSAAVMEPRRMAAAHLSAAGLGHDWPELDQVIRSGSLSPMTSSAGRLFDAAAYILGVSPARVAMQAEAARLFESAADPGEKGYFDMDVGEDCVIDPSRAIRGLLDDRIPVPARAAMFHNGFARALVRAVSIALGGRRMPVALAGGCWANKILLRAAGRLLSDEGLEVLICEDLPLGDGAVPAGQAAAVAAALIGGGDRPAPGR